MTTTYRGPCEELYGRQIEVPDHACLEHLRYGVAHCVETHGLECGPYERWDEEYWECVVCRERYSHAEVAA